MKHPRKQGITSTSDIFYPDTNGKPQEIIALMVLDMMLPTGTTGDFTELCSKQ